MHDMTTWDIGAHLHAWARLHTSDEGGQCSTELRLNYR